ncbi:hypothetical protein ANCCAN_07918 [Ancylostoma caninum]|uniref:MULE transposase domain-containing protein n=1 Tax=Ancylostoma caninum TaxID=29170 RepID=A0A368GNW6_ANCCA|nr:hypothetical protein ANCCAN_07918 [Ancylostoma caninum]
MDSPVLIMDFEMAAMNAIRAEWGVDVLGCLFHFGDAIQRNRDKHGLRMAVKKKPAVRTFFRRLQVLPMLPEHLHALSGILTPPQQPTVNEAEERSLAEFMAYMSRTWSPPNGQFTGLRNHSRNHGARTTNYVEGSHTRIHHAFGARTPTLREMIRHCKTEITMAKSLIPSYFDGSLNSRYVRPDEQDRQARVLQEMTNFREVIAESDGVPTSRQCKSYLDNIARFLAADNI